MATNPGDGKTNPFGNGNGGGGSRAGANNFVANPRGAAGGGAKPRDFRTAQPQPKTTGEGVNPDSVAAAGIVPQIDPPDDPEIGTRPLGQNAHKPYKLGG